MRLVYAVLASSLLGACSLYGGNQPPPPCKAVLDTAPAEELRDPSTGLCQFIGGGGGCPVDACGPCEGTGALIPNWPSCSGSCESLAESDCLAASACHAAYSIPNGLLDVAVRPAFMGCWEIAPLPPETGTCDGLDAWTCATHTDCASVLAVSNDPSTGGKTAFFDHCMKEMAPLDPGTCDASQVVCNSAPPACPTNTVPGVANGCWSGYCIPTADCPDLACTQLTTESACLARADCAATYTGTNCTCDANGVCTCATETFASCETR